MPEIFFNRDSDLDVTVEVEPGKKVLKSIGQILAGFRVDLPKISNEGWSQEELLRVWAMIDYLMKM